MSAEPRLAPRLSAFTSLHRPTDALGKRRRSPTNTRPQCCRIRTVGRSVERS